MHQLISITILLGCVYFTVKCDPALYNNGVTEGGDACSCGLKKPTRIVGGQETLENEYPWQASFKYQGNHVCGGSIISKKWVVSAAHCVFGKMSKYRIVVGEHDISQSDSISKEFKVSKIITHASYSSSTLDNDIALFKVKGTIKFSDQILPACLPIDLPELSSGDILTVTGWGTTSSGGSASDVLMEVEVNYITTEECRSDDYQYGDEITDNMICAGVSGGGKDSCQGDSGGPIVYEDCDSAANFLMGVVSWGYGCADADSPGVYTKVTNYLNWIKQKTKAGKEFCIV